MNGLQLAMTGTVTTTDDAAAAARLAAPWHRSLYRFALALCGRDPDEAAEVVQQTYLEVIEGRAALSGAAEPRAFLLGVARRVAASRRRGRWMRERLLAPLGVVREPTAPAECGPEHEAAAGERGVLIRRALAQLPARQLQVATLVFLEDISVERAAEVMGVSVGSARRHYHRAKRALTRLLEDIDERG